MAGFGIGDLLQSLQQGVQSINNLNTTVTSLNTIVTAISSALQPGTGQTTNVLSSDTIYTSSASTNIVSLTQGTTGVWWVTATVTGQNNTAVSVNGGFRLTDGTTVFGSQVTAMAAGIVVGVSMSGWIQNPVGNISIAGTISSNWRAYQNLSGTSKDTYISGFRIA